MPAPVFAVRVFGDKLFIERNERTMARVMNMKPGWLRVTSYMMGRTKERFDLQGPGWKPLSPDWKFQKQAHGWDLRILRQHGNLFQSVTTPRAPGQLLIITNDGIQFGSTLEYAATHQEGRDAIPARPFLKVDLEDRGIIAEILSQYIAAPLQGRSRTDVRTSGLGSIDLSKWGTRGSSRSAGTVFGRRTGLPAYGGQESLRGPGGRFIGVTDWE